MQRPSPRKGFGEDKLTLFKVDSSTAGRERFMALWSIRPRAGRERMMAPRAAAQEVVDRRTGRKATVLSDYDLIYASEGSLPEGDGHAGAGETSRILTANPDLVKGRAPAGKNGIPPYAVVDD